MFDHAAAPKHRSPLPQVKRTRRYLAAITAVAGAIIIAGVSLVSSFSPHHHGAQLGTLTADDAGASVARLAVPQPAMTTASVNTARAMIAHQARTRYYAVQRGDTLSRIAGRLYGSPADWPVLYWANKHQIRWASDITTTMSLLVPPLPASIPAAPRHLAPAPPPAPKVVLASTSVGTSPVTSNESAPSVGSETVGTAGMGSFQACVISRESGGNPSIVNASSGAGGLYQFLPSTWASLGFSGLPEDASVATQNAAFAKAYAEDGTSPWGPSDGC
jgi:resuscitation-promoting factor RpfC